MERDSIDASAEVDRGKSIVYPFIRTRPRLEEKHASIEAPWAFLDEACTLLGVGEFEANEEGSVELFEKVRAPIGFPPPETGENGDD